MCAEPMPIPHTYNRSGVGGLGVKVRLKGEVVIPIPEP